MGCSVSRKKHQEKGWHEELRRMNIGNKKKGRLPSNLPLKLNLELLS